MARRPLNEAAGLFGAAAEAKPHHIGHRERLKARFMEAGAGALADYELMELVLFRAIPQGDVKPLAKTLLETFGDFNHAISADAARLRQIKGVGEAVVRELKIVEAAAHRLARAKVINRPALSSWAAVMDYCKTVMAHRGVEEFRLLFLDRKNVLIADEPQARGTVDQVPVYPREVAKRALELGASAVIMVHNHPSGDPTPSQADIAMTRKVREALGAVEIRLHDHIVIGKDTDATFVGLGLL
jgi:DNA repair protein RadC